jgi:hypothetical protein
MAALYDLSVEMICLLKCRGVSSGTATMRQVRQGSRKNLYQNVATGLPGTVCDDFPLRLTNFCDICALN